MKLLIKLFIDFYCRFVLRKPMLAKRINFYIPDWRTFYRTGRNEINYMMKRDTGYHITCIVVEISARCNLDCIMCARHKAMTRKQGDMSMEVFRTMVDKNPDVSMYILVGWGEMMLNKHFFDMVYYLRSQKKSVALTTNLTLFNDENIDKILNSGIKHITVSMDGIDEVYEKNRQTAFSAIEENLKKLSAKIKENGNEIFLEINSISSPEVMEKEEEMLNRIGPLVDQIRFSSCLDYNNLKKTNRTKPCREFWRGMISVLYDGRVVPCCMDYNASMVIGHVDEDSLQNIWNNEKTRSLRREQLKLQFKRRCATCYEMEPEDGKKVQKRFD